MIKKLFIANMLGITIYACLDDDQNEGIMINHQNIFYSLLSYNQNDNQIVYLFDSNITLFIQKVYMKKNEFISEKDYYLQVLFRYKGNAISKNILYEEFTKNYKNPFFTSTSSILFQFDKIQNLLQ
jgi:hypothetical protein